MNPEQHTDRTLLLGIDTGGTYTDAVVFDEATGVVVAKAKSPTTHHDLSIGIRGAIDVALGLADVAAHRIELVSLSTTLATNALVEGKGRPIAAIIIGFDQAVVERAGLAEALGSDPAIFIAGGHDSHGSQVAALDLDQLAQRIEDEASHVDAFAVTAQFSVRNPEHEIAASELVRNLTGKPVSSSHHLSVKLNGPKRAVTAILNARLVSIIDELVGTTEHTLVERGVHAPLMVVRGDGSLVSAAFVRERPIETILSGPAASLVGAAHLTGLTDAIISDIGGTTTDIAVLRSGVPAVSQDGAIVGGHRTMVSAVAMHTHGLGGDSRVQQDHRGAGPALLIGPRRVIPLCLLATQQPEFVHDALDLQLAATTPGELDGIIIVAEDRALAMATCSGAELQLLQAMDGRLAVASRVIGSLMGRRILERLVQRGTVQLAAFTPTDANHVLGAQSTYDTTAAVKAAALFARSRDRLGRPIAPDGPTIARLTVDTLVRRSAEAVLAAAFGEDGLPDDTATSRIIQDAIDHRLSVVQLSLGLAVPLVGLGASAASYYPQVAELLGSTAIVPHHADVANAIGAVVGRVRITLQCTIGSPQSGQYLVHAGTAPEMFADLAAATAHAEGVLAAELQAEMTQAGAPVFETTRSWTEQVVDVGGSPLFVEGVLSLTASGRPLLEP